MGRIAITYSLDVEASGPVPGPWWMCSLGLCRTDDTSVGILKEFRIELPFGQTNIEPEVGIVIRPKIGLELAVTRETVG